MHQSVERFQPEAADRTALAYLLHVPGGEPPEAGWPLLLFLHGAGERGEDVERVAVYGPPMRIEAGEDLPFVVVSPQCPSGHWWSRLVPELLDLLDAVQERLPIDPERVCLTGLSMGGEGVWELAAAAPERFAALAPVCGVTRPTQADRHARVPTWVFHGVEDDVVDVGYSERMVRALQERGASPRVTLYPGVGHDSWTDAYAPDTGLLPWLLEQRRPRGEDGAARP